MQQIYHENDIDFNNNFFFTCIHPFKYPIFKKKCFITFCTDQVIGSDDVAASDNIGVLNGTPD